MLIHNGQCNSIQPNTQGEKTMKKMLSAVIACAMFASIASIGSVAAMAAPQAFKGTISDSMCKRKHMMPGKSDATCIEECVKAGSSYVLLVGDKAYTLSAQKGALTPFAGKNVVIQGELKGDTIQVSSVHQ